MKIIFIFLIFLAKSEKLSISQKRVRLHKGRVLAIEEGFNEQISNEKFLRRLDVIDTKLDNFELKLLSTQKQAYEKLDALTGKMTSAHNIHTISNFFHKKLAKKRFDSLIENAVIERNTKLEKAISIRDKLKGILQQKQKGEFNKLHLKEVNSKNLSQIQDLLSHLSSQNQPFSLEIKLPTKKESNVLKI